MAAIERDWGTLDFLVHSLAFSDRNELKGRYVETSRANFISTLNISCFSFTDVARRAAKLMKPGSALVTLTFGGGSRVMPNYNVMGVRRPPSNPRPPSGGRFGKDGIRVNAISAGPMRTLAPALAMPAFYK